MHREMGQPSLAESLLPQTLGRNERLERIDAMIDWEWLGRLVSRVYSAREGRPSYPPITMVKALLIQQWYNLSDPQMEEALADRISFRRFVGLGLQDDTPDYSTLSRFHSTLERLGLSERLFEELGEQLDGLGLVLKEGTLVEAQVRRPPVSAGRGVKSAVDPDADWRQSQGGRRSWRLPHWQRRRNESIAPVRAPVEKVFGTLKRSYGYTRVWYRGLGRNAVGMWLKSMAYNLRRAVELSGCSV